MVNVDFLNDEHDRAISVLASEELAQVAARFPLGSRVLFRPVMGEPEQEDTVVRSEPWALGSGDIVLKVNGRAGGVHVDHLTLISVDEVPARHRATSIGE